MKATTIGLLGLCLAASCLSGCKPAHTAPAAHTAPPATVMQITNEKNLAEVTLTPEAAKKVGIRIANIELKPMPRRRIYGGEIMIPPGRSFTVTAPISGTILALGESQGTAPVAGAVLDEGQPVFNFLPLLSPERAVLTPAERVRYAEAQSTLATSRIEAEGQVAKAKVELDAAQVELTRSERMLKDKVGSQRAVADAQARLDKARKELTAAQSRQGLLAKIKLDAEGGSLKAEPIVAPQKGVLQNLHVAAGQTVTAGAPLFEVVDPDRIWIRVPIFVGDEAEVDPKAPAMVGALSGGQPEKWQMANPVAAPPTADPAGSTVDLYYELSGQGGALQRGRRVGIQVALRGEQESLIAPWSAVLYDIHGGAWVYRKTAENTFVRSRVEVQFVQQGLVVLSSGPKPGTPVVAEGAIELFGTEFGNSK